MSEYLRPKLHKIYVFNERGCSKSVNCYTSQAAQDIPKIVVLFVQIQQASTSYYIVWHTKCVFHITIQTKQINVYNYIKSGE